MKDFEQRHPEVEVSVTPHARNAWGHPDDRPFAANPDALPHVFPIHIGRYCADLPFLADRGLIEPLGDALVHLGLTQESFPPNVLEAVTYRGKIWAIPHHVLVDGLQMNRELAMILGINTPPGSWQEVFDWVAAAVDQGHPATFSASGNMLELAEFLAMSCGNDPIDLVDAAAWTTPRFGAALDLLQRASAAKELSFRPANEPLRVSATSLFGLGRVESVNEFEPYVLIPYPTRLYKDDQPAPSTRVPAMLEAYVVRTQGESVRQQVATYLQWLLSEETEWQVFEHTNLRGAEASNLLDSVHVPLRESVLGSLDFEYARNKFPAFEIQRANVRGACFSRWPASIEAVAVQRADEMIRREIDTLPSSSWLPSLRESVNMLVKSTPAETAVYNAY